MKLRWKILALLVLVRFGLGFQFQTVASVSGPLSQQFNLDHTTIGKLIGLFMLTGLFLALPAGWVGRYINDRIFSSLGMALLAAGGFIAAAADSTGQIGFGRIVCGAGFVICTIYFAKMTTDWFAGHEIATAMGLLVMTWPMGIAAGQIIHTWLAHNSHWSMAFIVASSFCTIGAIALLVGYRSPENTQQPLSDQQPTLATAIETTKKTVSTNQFSRKELILVVVASMSWALFNAGYMVFLSFAPGWLVESGYAPVKAASIISSASWVMMISIVLAGVVADRTKRPDIVLYGCMVVAVTSMLALFWTDFALPVCLIFGLIGAAPAGIIMTLATEALEPQNRAQGMGVFFSLYFLLLAPAPVLAGWIVDYSGSAWLAIAFAATLFSATAMSFLAFRITQKAIQTAV